MVDKELVRRLRDAKRNSILSRIGNTPCVELDKIKDLLKIPKKIRLFAKIEGLNPGGSIKDRPALSMIDDAIENGMLTREKIVIDSTSGNTGIAYAMICSVLGIRLKLCIPANASKERLKILSAMGAEIIETDPLEGSDGAMETCKKIMENNADIYFKPDQYNNPQNPKAHQKTAEEIWHQTKGNVDFLVAGVGTGGTIMGAGKTLKELKRDITVVAVEPEDPFHGLEGLRNLETSVVPGIFDISFPDLYKKVKTEDAYAMVRNLSRQEGLFVGASSGAVMKAASDIIREHSSNVQSIVMIFPDLGDRYFSTGLWEGVK